MFKDIHPFYFWLSVLFALFTLSSCEGSFTEDIIVNQLGIGGEELDAMWIKIDGHSPATRVYFNGKPALTSYVDASLITCPLPDYLVRYEVLSVEIKDLYTNKKSKPFLVEYTPEISLDIVDYGYSKMKITNFGLGGEQNEALWVQAEGRYNSSTLVHLNGHARPTLNDAGIITCLLPENMNRIEHVKIQLIDTLRSLKSNIVKGMYFPDSTIVIQAKSRRELLVEG